MPDRPRAILFAVSSRAKRGTCFLLSRSTAFCLTALFLAASFSSSSTAQERSRPRILGIASVQLYSTDLSAAHIFYYDQVLDSRGTLGDEPVGKGPSPLVIILPSSQILSLSKPVGAPPSNLLTEITFATDDLNKMKKYLSAHHVPEEKASAPRKSYFSVLDPEGHRISFVDGPGIVEPSIRDIHREQQNQIPQNPTNYKIIHAGFVVHDRAAEDKFYKDILGFHVYWHGGMKDGEDNWVDMQVPDGTDWIEYMLGISPNASHKTLGVMNHIALGVPNIHKAQEQLIKNGWKSTEEPKIGRDGKWQLNLYDPDETRVELMEFKPTKDPCCSPYTGPHPKP